MVSSLQVKTLIRGPFSKPALLRGTPVKSTTICRCKLSRQTTFTPCVRAQQPFFLAFHHGKCENISIHPSDKSDHALTIAQYATAI
jgi:hypothetical protein